MYTVKIPRWLPKLFHKRMVWNIQSDDNAPTVYITFDDGPHTVATPFVLDCLKMHNAKATFFCIGKNVVDNPEIFSRILNEGHAIGNHTYDHLNGWKTSLENYIDNIIKAVAYIPSRLFRPPYGKIRRTQALTLFESNQPWKIIMWDVLSADFDINISPEKCLENVIKNIRPGSIVVFHDSEKAWPRMQYALPKVLAFCQDKGWEMRKINDDFLPTL